VHFRQDATSGCKYIFIYQSKFLFLNTYFEVVIVHVKNMLFFFIKNNVSENFQQNQKCGENAHSYTMPKDSFEIARNYLVAYTFQVIILK